MKYRSTVAALNAFIGISIVQWVWKCQYNEWRSLADFRPITTQIRNVISGVTAPKFTQFFIDLAASSLVLMPLCIWRYCIPLQNSRAKTEGGQFRCKFCKSAPNQLITIATSLERSYNNITLIIPTHMSIKAEYGRDWSSIF